MRFIAGLIAIAGIAGLVALLAPIDGPAVLPFMFKGDGETKLRAFILLAAFGLGAVFGVFAITKERMSRLHSTCTLVGFAAAAFVTKIWEFVKQLVSGDGVHLVPLVIFIAIALGLIGSLLALIKNRAAY